MWVDIEGRALNKGFKRPVGLDEVGRGPLAGPVVAAACYLPKHVKVKNLRDSKALSSAHREEIYSFLINHPDVDLAIGVVEAEEIDQINILQASLKAMMIAVEGLKVPPDYLIIDGNRSPKTSITCDPIVKADAKVLSVAGASVIAKVYRDGLMMKMHEIYPQYGFNCNKGYPTAVHLKAINEHGICPLHRISFAPVREVLQRG